MAFTSDSERSETIAESVTETIDHNDIVLFMKGTPTQPQCGYSQRAVGLISRYTTDIESVNVLTATDAYREALATHSGRKTIPQTFVGGTFVGGSDVLRQLEARDELEATLST